MVSTYELGLRCAFDSWWRISNRLACSAAVFGKTRAEHPSAGGLLVAADQTSAGEDQARKSTGGR